MRRVLASLALALVASIAVGVHAQGFPSRAVTLITPFPPGGSTDAVARILAERMRATLEDLKGLVAWMKANPGKATFVNQNAAAQTSGVLLKQLAGVDFLFVPYRGAGPAMQDIIAGHVDLLVVQAAAALPQVKAGTVMAAKRSPTIPDIPTVDEGGVAGWHMPGWFGLFAPKGTPKEAIAKLNEALVQTLADPGVRKRFADLGLDIASREQQTPEGLAAFHKAEIDKWWPIIKAAGIKAE